MTGNIDNRRQRRGPGVHLSRWLMVASAIGCFAAFAGADSKSLASKSDAYIRNSDKSGMANVIVRLKNGLNDVVRRDLARLKGAIQHEYPAIESIDIQLPASALEALAGFKWVERISSDAMVEKADAFTTSGSMSAAATTQFGANGTGVTVAVIDSGVSPHVDSLLKIEQLAFLTGSNGSFLLDDCGHGTHVAGIINGSGALSSGLTATQTFYGVARGAKVLSVRVLDREGKGTVGDVLAGMQWVLDNRLSRNIRVVNMSLGHVAFESYKVDPLCLMAEKLWKAGVVVVCAAGNDGRRNASPSSNRDNEGYGANYGSINSPGNSPYVITVGAMKRPGTMRSTDQIATYSGRGPSVFDHVLKPDILAPGNRVISLGYTGTYLNDAFSDTNTVALSEYYKDPAGLYNLGTLLGQDGLKSSTYFRMSGTSMAAPVVSGAVSMMLNANPMLTPDQIKARLMFTATKWNDQSGVSDPCSMGAGYLNVLEAMKSRITVTGPVLSPSMFADSKGKVYINFKSIMTASGLWGSGQKDPRVVWGSRAMTPSSSTISTTTSWSLNADVTGGTRAVWGHTLAVDGTRAVWGSSDDSDGTRAVWGHGSASCDLSSVAITGE